MLPRNSLVSKKYATLTVLEYAFSRNKNHYWKCECAACGKIVVMAASNLKNPNLRSCGCLRSKPGRTHQNWKGFGDIPASYLCKIKTHAKRRGIKVNLTVEYLWELFLSQQGKCALSGIPLTYPQSFKALSMGEGNASLDRIDSSKIYEPGNVQWVDKRINFMKQQLQQEEFIMLCKKVSEYQENKK